MMSNQENQNLSPNEKDEIDFNRVFNTIKRDKKTFFVFSTLLTTLGIFYSLLKKPVFQGYFQIIVEDNQQESNSLNRLNNIQSVYDLVGGNSSNNKTQEEILRSPLVLMPVYESFKEENDQSALSYNGWLKSYLKIKFEKGTNVLTIKYSNPDKDKIISTLSLISKKYQDYSKSDRERSLSQGIQYLGIQQEKAIIQSQNSLKALNKFSIENGLGDTDGLIPNDNLILNNINPSNNGSLKFGNIMSKDFSQDFGAGKRYSSQFALLESSEALYSDLSSKLKPNSILMKNLESKIESLRESLKRPNEILIKYRELKRKAIRDERILTNIEQNLSILKLDQVRQPDPWKLITTPTIEDSRLSPKRKQIVISSFLLSLVFSISLIFFKDKRKNLIYETQDFKDNIPFNFIDYLYTNNIDLNTKLFKSLVNKKSKIENLYILKLQDSLFLNQKVTSISFFNPDIDVQFIDLKSLDKLNSKDLLIMIVERGTLTYKKLELLNNYLKVHKENILGWYLIDNETTF